MRQINKYRHQRRRRSMSYYESFNKRAFDIVGAIGGLVILSPLICLTSLMIMIDSPGPVLCRLKRYSADNTEFEIFEFRTWPVDQQEKATEQRTNQLQCITRVGRILRQSGIDALPHLISVLCGEMSIVGTHMFVNAPGKRFPSLDMNEARPGLVTCAYADGDQGEIVDTTKSIDRCIDCDRCYLEKRSFFFDMKLLFRALLSKKTYL
jgi:putative colanic acid biosynthesis UDP-glucose lipid carrier transferase